MEIRSILALAALGIGGVLLWRTEHQYRLIQESLREMEAGARITSPWMPTGIDVKGRKLSLRKGEGDRQAAARQLCWDWISLEAAKKAKVPRESALRREQQWLAITLRVGNLGPEEWDAFLDELKNFPEVEETERRSLLVIALGLVGQSDGAKALELFRELSRAGDPGLSAKSSGVHAIMELATEDPMKAVDWLERHGELLDNEAKRQTVRIAARQDLRQSVEVARRLGMENELGSALGESAETPEDREKVVGFLREQGRSEWLEPALASIGARLANGSYEESMAWIHSMNFSDEEYRSLSEGVHYWTARQETGQWLAWMDRTIGKDASPRVTDLVWNWTRNDYLAAGEWLTKIDDGPTKPAAVAGYIKAVTPYDPAAAAKWVATLPAGDRREKSARELYQQWRAQDEEAAKAFAEKEGIGTE